MKYDPIPSHFFARNRNRFMRKMQPDSLAVFYSNDQVYRSGDTTFPFKQNEGLFYLSGLDQPETVLVLFPDCVKDGFQEVVFIRRPNAFSQRWEGGGLTLEDARDRSGIAQVFWVDDLDRILHELILLAKRIYVNIPEHEGRQHYQGDANARMARTLIDKYPAHKFHRSQPVLRKLTMIKTSEEIDLIGRAIQITAKAFDRVMEVLRPGMGEYEVEAELTYMLLKNRASGHAYPPIVASGPRSCILHYQQNSQICKAGDIVLMDFGAEYAHYAADVSRVIPVDDQFSERQRTIYNGVYQMLERIKPLLVPGKTLEEYHQEVGKVAEDVLLELDILSSSEVARQSANYPAYKNYFMHAASHHIGMQVHDPANRYEPIQAGMVFTCEPGIYLPREELGIRLENMVLVTDAGPIDLTKNIPVDLEEIEERRQKYAVSE